MLETSSSSPKIPIRLQMATAVPEVQVRQHLLCWNWILNEHRAENPNLICQEKFHSPRTLVISGDHNYSDAGETAESNRSCHLCSGRIQHAHAADERQIGLDDNKENSWTKIEPEPRDPERAWWSGLNKPLSALTSYSMKRVESSSTSSSLLIGLSLVARARQRKVSLPVPYSLMTDISFSLMPGVSGTLLLPTRTCVHLSITPSGAP